MHSTQWPSFWEVILKICLSVFLFYSTTTVIQHSTPAPTEAAEHAHHSANNALDANSNANAAAHSAAHNGRYVYDICLNLFLFL